MNRICRLANEFCISCGTVTIDTKRDDIPVLLIRDRQSGEFLLPKGRKNVGESLQAAAERETYEETGIDAKILPLNFDTLATSSADSQQEDLQGLCEPIAVTGREVKNNVLKLIYWFVASADSTAIPAPGTQQAGEDYENHWVAAKDIISTLSWPDDRRIAEEAIRIYRASSVATHPDIV